MLFCCHVSEAVQEKANLGAAIYKAVDDKSFRATLSTALAYAKDWDGGRTQRKNKD